MSLEQLREEIPGYAEDLKLNLSSVLQQTELSSQQLWGTAVACAFAGQNERLYKSVVADALQLTAAQKLKIRTIQEEAFRRDPRSAFCCDKQIYEVLTDRQTAEWKRMKGDPFDFRKLRHRRRDGDNGERRGSTSAREPVDGKS